MKDEPKTSVLTLKDWLALFFSTAALVLSVVGFYFSNFRVDDSLQARVTETTLASDRSSPDSETHYVVARIVFINTGNRPALVLGATYQMTEPGHPEHGGFGADTDVPKNTWPMVIQPRDIRLVDLRVPVKHLADNLANGAPEPKPSWNIPGKTVQFNLAMEFFAVDSHGQSYDVWSDPFAKVEVHEKGFAGVERLNKKYPVTSLFQSRK